MIDRIKRALAPKTPPPSQMSVSEMDNAATQARINELQALVENDVAPAYLSSADMQIILKAIAVYIRDLERRVRDMMVQKELAEQALSEPVNPRVMAKALADMGKARDLYNHLRDESEARWQSTQ
jgi:heme oxygenase